MNYISIELVNEVGEIVVFEIFRKQIPSENGRVPNDECCSSIIPQNHIVGGDFINKMVCFGEKWHQSGFLRVAVMFRRCSHGGGIVLW